MTDVLMTVFAQDVINLNSSCLEKETCATTVCPDAQTTLILQTVPPVMLLMAGN